MRKFLFKILAATFIVFSFNLSYSISDYYKKVYVLKINKTELYEHIDANENQKKSLEKIFKKYQIQADNLSDKYMDYKDKVTKLNSIKSQRKNDIYKVLSANQIKKYNEYLNKAKVDFEERNNNISEKIDSLNLSHTQKANILRYENEFQRNVDRLLDGNLSSDEFSDEYHALKNIRNEKIALLLNEEQLEKLTQ